MKAIILCAGRGTRLQPLTDVAPKSLLLIGGKPILEHILDNLPKKITEVFLVVDYLSDKIKSFILNLKDNYSFTIECTQQVPGKKGTMAALLSAKNKLLKNERFLVLNGDDIVEKKDLEKMIEHKRSFGVNFRIMPNYYKVVFDDNKNLLSFIKQNDIEKINGSFIATGVYVLDFDIFNFKNRILNGDEIGYPKL